MLYRELKSYKFELAQTYQIQTEIFPDVRQTANGIAWNNYKIDWSLINTFNRSQIWFWGTK